MLDKYGWLLALVVCFFAGCGGGDESFSPPLNSAPAGSTVAMRAAGGAASSAITPEDAARQLMDFGESSYPDLFPGHKTTYSFPPFVYRYYPESEIYLGVVLTANSAYELNGVYVMGGPFGTAPRYGGPLTTFITPIAQTQTLTFIAGPGGVVSDPTIPLGSPPGAVWTAASVDLQGDGRRDFILGMGVFPQSAQQPAALHILRPNSSGTALFEVTRQLLGQGELPTTFGAVHVASGDFNGDGKPDLYIAAIGIDHPPLVGERNVLLVSNADGTYTDRSSTLPAAPDGSSRAAIGDINGDAIPDLFVNNSPLPVRSYFLVGKGDGTFEQATNRLPSDVAVANGSTFDTALLVDLDGDGFADLVLGSFADGEGRNLVLYNDGAGNFAARPRVRLPVGAFGPTADTVSVLAMDVNGDGRMDLLILSTQTGAQIYMGAAVQLLINQGDGVFVDETAARLGSSASRTVGILWDHLRSADLNGDGRLDFYATGHQQLGSNGNVSLTVPMIWLNNGDGTFTAVNSGIFPDTPEPLDVVDVDGDGRLDFVTAYVDATGQIFYRTFLNRTPRSVPGEPIIGLAIAGNAQATIAFNAPLGSGPSPITGYTATCTAGALSGVTTASSSPLIVSGLTNGKSYSCSVRALSAAGPGLPSAAAMVRPLQ